MKLGIEFPITPIWRLFKKIFFDESSLMSDPKLKQMDTMNQGNMVSAPYFQANKMAAEKTNPMNAISQETPVGDRVDDFLNRMGK